LASITCISRYITSKDHGPRAVRRDGDSIANVQQRRCNAGGGIGRVEVHLQWVPEDQNEAPDRWIRGIESLELNVRFICTRVHFQYDSA